MDSELIVGVNAAKCYKCGDIKLFEFFYKNKKRKNGHNSECKICSATNHKKYYLKNLEKYKANVKKWAANNPEKKIARNKKWAANNPEKNKLSKKKWAANNPEKNKLRLKKWRLSNVEKRRKSHAACHIYNSVNLTEAYVSCLLKIKSEQREQYKPLIEAKRAQIQLLRACK